MEESSSAPVTDLYAWSKQFQQFGETALIEVIPSLTRGH